MMFPFRFFGGECMGGGVVDGLMLLLLLLW